jgi:O-antigen ligase
MTRITKNDILLLLGALTCAIPFFNFSLFQAFDVASPIFVLAINFALLIINIKKIAQEHFIQLMVTAVALLLLVVQMKVVNNGVGSCLIMMSLYLMLLNATCLTIGNHMRKTIGIIFAGLLFLYLFIDKSSFNTNTVAYAFFIFYIFSLDFASSIRAKFTRRTLTTIIMLAAAYGIYLSQSRSVLYAFLLSIIMWIFPKKLINRPAVKNIFIFIMLFGPIVWALLYVYMWQHDFSLQLFTNKDFFSGRQLIWNEAFTVFGGSSWLGIGSKYVLRSFDSFNMHNSMLDILVVYGLLNFIIFIPILYRQISRCFRAAASNKKNMRMLYALISIFFIGFSETNLIWANVSFYLLLILVYINSRVDSRDILEKSDTHLKLSVAQND